MDNGGIGLAFAPQWSDGRTFVGTGRANRTVGLLHGPRSRRTMTAGERGDLRWHDTTVTEAIPRAAHSVGLRCSGDTSHVACAGAWDRPRAGSSDGSVAARSAKAVDSCFRTNAPTTRPAGDAMDPEPCRYTGWTRPAPSAEPKIGRAGTRSTPRHPDTSTAHRRLASCLSAPASFSAAIDDLAFGCRLRSGPVLQP